MLQQLLCWPSNIIFHRESIPMLIVSWTLLILDWNTVLFWSKESVIKIRWKNVLNNYVGRRNYCLWSRIYSGIEDSNFYSGNFVSYFCECGTTTRMKKGLVYLFRLLRCFILFHSPLVTRFPLPLFFALFLSAFVLRFFFVRLFIPLFPLFFSSFSYLPHSDESRGWKEGKKRKVNLLREFNIKNIYLDFRPNLLVIYFFKEILISTDSFIFIKLIQKPPLRSSALLVNHKNSIILMKICTVTH